MLEDGEVLAEALAEALAEGLCEALEDALGLVEALGLVAEP